MSRSDYDDMPSEFGGRRGRGSRKLTLAVLLGILVVLIIVVIKLIVSPEEKIEALPPSVVEPVVVAEVVDVGNPLEGEEGGVEEGSELSESVEELSEEGEPLPEELEYNETLEDLTEEVEFVTESEVESVDEGEILFSEDVPSLEEERVEDSYSVDEAFEALPLEEPLFEEVSATLEFYEPVEIEPLGDEEASALRKGLENLISTLTFSLGDEELFVDDSSEDESVVEMEEDDTSLPSAEESEVLVEEEVSEMEETLPFSLDIMKVVLDGSVSMEENNAVIKGTPGCAVYSPISGTVTYCGRKGTLKAIELETAEGYLLTLSGFERVVVSKGMEIKESTILGSIGTTGNSSLTLSFRSSDGEEIPLYRVI